LRSADRRWVHHCCGEGSPKLRRSPIHAVSGFEEGRYPDGRHPFVDGPGRTAARPSSDRAWRVDQLELLSLRPQTLRRNLSWGETAEVGGGVALFRRALLACHSGWEKGTKSTQLRSYVPRPPPGRVRRPLRRGRRVALGGVLREAPAAAVRHPEASGERGEHG